MCIELCHQRGHLLEQDQFNATRVLAYERRLTDEWRVAQGYESVLEQKS